MYITPGSGLLMTDTVAFEIDDPLAFFSPAVIKRPEAAFGKKGIADQATHSHRVAKRRDPVTDPHSFAAGPVTILHADRRLCQVALFGDVVQPHPA